MGRRRSRLKWIKILKNRRWLGWNITTIRPSKRYRQWRLHTWTMWKIWQSPNSNYHWCKPNSQPQPNKNNKSKKNSGKKSRKSTKRCEKNMNKAHRPWNPSESKTSPSPFSYSKPSKNLIKDDDSNINKVCLRKRLSSLGIGSKRNGPISRRNSISSSHSIHNLKKGLRVCLKESKTYKPH